ncbi:MULTISPECIES: hypothetical protein [unclassified Streptomyces]|uniref:hypothetical protein n=1 Tax=unclassified Streptomyces TaxID=2593676 RepID=UPI000AAA73E5|nr:MULTISPECIES: hypothetical protein [unclassified Streptomyces]
MEGQDTPGERSAAQAAWSTAMLFTSRDPPEMLGKYGCKAGGGSHDDYATS